MGRWNPQYIIRKINSILSSTEVVIVETDLGPGFLKAIGNPAGTHCLASEYVATQLAEWLGLSTLEYGLVDIDADLDDIRLYTGRKAQSGPAFITKLEAGEPWDGSRTALRMVVNPEEMSKIVVFDTWVINRDRKSRLMAVTDNVLLSTSHAPKGKLRLVAIDHTHCFVTEECGRLVDLEKLAKADEPEVYGLFSEFREHLNRAIIRETSDRLRKMDSGTASAIVESIPDAWEISRSIRDRWTEQILQRAIWTATEIEERVLGALFQQRDLGFGKSEDAT